MGNVIEFPEQRPEILIQRMQFRIAGHDCACERPIFRMLHQFLDTGVINDVKAYLAKGVTFALFLAQNVIVWLVLKAMRLEQFADMLAQKLHAVSLISLAPQPHPDQMNVIRHQAIGRAEQTFAHRSVQHYFPKAGVEKFVEPTLAARGKGQGPVNDCVTLVILAGRRGR